MVALVLNLSAQSGFIWCTLLELKTLPLLLL